MPVGLGSTVSIAAIASANHAALDMSPRQCTGHDFDRSHFRKAPATRKARSATKPTTIIAARNVAMASPGC